MSKPYEEYTPEDIYNMRTEIFQLKQENNKLKEEIKTNSFGCFNIEMSEQLDKLKEELTISIQENEEGREINAELKLENEELKRQYKELGQCSKGLKEYFEKEKETLSNRFLKLKQALKEIKEIAKPYYTLGSKDTPVAQILQKISEVENVNI